MCRPRQRNGTKLPLLERPPREGRVGEGGRGGATPTKSFSPRAGVGGGVGDSYLKMRLGVDGFVSSCRLLLQRVGPPHGVFSSSRRLAGGRGAFSRGGNFWTRGEAGHHNDDSFTLRNQVK